MLNSISGLMVSMLTSDMVDHRVPGWVKAKTNKLVFASSLLSK